MIHEWDVVDGGEGVGEDEARLVPGTAAIGGDRHPDLEAVAHQGFLVAAEAGVVEVVMAVVVEGREVAVGELEEHGRGVGMYEWGWFRV